MALTDLDARHRTALPSIIAGDFNTSPDAASIRYLTGLQSLGGRSVRCHDAWAVAGNGPAQLAFDRPVDGIWPSDHLGVAVDIDISAYA